MIKITRKYIILGGIILLSIITILTLTAFVYHKTINSSNKAGFTPSPNAQNDNWIIAYTNKPYIKKKHTNTWAIDHDHTRFTLNKDAVITSISFQLKNINVTNSIDICIYAIDKTGKNGTNVPIYGEFSEKLCYRVRPAYKLKNITRTYDFSKFPLYMPKGITLIVGSAAWGLEESKHLIPRFTAKIELAKYKKNMPVYSLIRLPYLDTKSDLKTGHTEQTKYIAPVGYPLKVSGLIYYLDINKGENHTCLEWKNKQGKIKKKFCVPKVNLSPTQPIAYSTKIYRLNWNLTHESGDYITNYCTFKYKGKPLNPPGNCAIWALIEIPPSARGIPAIMRNWGIVPNQYLRYYCNHTKSHVLQNAHYFTRPDASPQEVRKACIEKLFQQPKACKNPIKPHISYINKCNKNFSQFLVKYTRPPFISKYYIRNNFLGNPWNKKCKPTFPYDICENNYTSQYINIIMPKINRKQSIFWVHSVSLCGKFSKPAGIVLRCK